MGVLLECVKDDQSRNGMLSVCQPLSDHISSEMECLVKSVETGQSRNGMGSVCQLSSESGGGAVKNAVRKHHVFTRDVTHKGKCSSCVATAVVGACINCDVGVCKNCLDGLVCNHRFNNMTRKEEVQCSYCTVQAVVECGDCYVNACISCLDRLGLQGLLVVPATSSRTSLSLDSVDSELDIFDSELDTQPVTCATTGCGPKGPG